jgi:hypothetical protein
MKKFWKVPTNNDFKECLKFLKVDIEFISILLDKRLEPHKYLSEKTNNFIIICFDNTENMGRNVFLNSWIYWGWGKSNDFDWFIARNYEYCGVVSLRKDKLKKINEYGKKL